MAIYGDGKHNENMEHVPKQEFDFYIDRKVSHWVREHHIIQADSLDEAKKEMVERFHDSMCVDTFDYQEALDDTDDYLEPGENGGQPTAELFYNDNLLTTNIE